MCLNDKKGNSEKGMAFLEVLVVSTLIAAIMMSLTYGVYAFANASLPMEAAMRGGYAKASALHSSLDRDFANADKVLLLSGQRATKSGVNPWETPANFDFSTVSAATIPGGISASTFVAFLQQNLFTITATPGSFEVYFLSGNSILSVLTIAASALDTRVEYNRYTRSAGLVNSFTFTDTVNLPSFVIADYQNASRPLAYTNRVSTTPFLDTLTIRIPNIRKMKSSTSTSTNATITVISSANLQDQIYYEPLELTRALP